VLLILWLVIDYLVFLPEQFITIAIIRIAFAAGLVLQARYLSNDRRRKSSNLALAVFLFNIPVSFSLTVFLLSGTPMEDGSLLLYKIYTLIPFISVVTLGVFPLTLIETLVLGLPLGVIAIGSWGVFGADHLMEWLPTAWLLIMMMGLVFFAATIQMQYIISLVSRTSFDPMTGALSRRSGIDSLVREFQMAVMHNDNFSVALVDIDDVDEIIASYNYPVYYYALLEAVKTLQQELRHSDMLVRWGEKEFLLVLPNTDLKGLDIMLERINKRGISSLPDGKPVTVSTGAAERVVDQLSDWHELVQMAEQRRDQARTC
jgi:diguanylate cyclase (GGDEF)-like protein